MVPRGRFSRLLGPLSIAMLAGSGASAHATATTTRAVSRSDARTVFLRDCAVCHGADARGTHNGPSLRGAGRASVDYWVSTGRMPLYTNTRPPKSPQGQAPPGQ